MGGRGGDTFKPPSPYEQLLPLPTPCFEMFLERSLNDPHPHHPTSSIFHCYPLHIHHPSPPKKILIIHHISSSSGQLIPIRFNKLFLNPQKMENREKLMNEHVLSVLKTQWISKRSDINVTLEMNRMAFLKVVRNHPGRLT